MEQLNSVIDYQIKKLLYRKSWRYKLGVEGQKVTNSLAEQKWNDGNLTYVDISIAEIIDWIYDKHGIWILVDWMTRIKPYNSGFYSHLRGTNKPLNQDNFISINNTKSPGYEVFNSPKEAYIEAIKYVLNNLIK